MILPEKRALLAALVRNPLLARAPIYRRTGRTDERAFKRFVDGMEARQVVGFVRYGFDRRFRYMSRMEREVVAYHRTGNAEHLLNVANYAYMESEKPENPLHHWDRAVGSVTRQSVK